MGVFFFKSVKHDRFYFHDSVIPQELTSVEHFNLRHPHKSSMVTGLCALVQCSTVNHFKTLGDIIPQQGSSSSIRQFFIPLLLCGVAGRLEPILSSPAESKGQITSDHILHDELMLNLHHRQFLGYFHYLVKFHVQKFLLQKCGVVWKNYLMLTAFIC